MDVGPGRVESSPPKPSAKWECGEREPELGITDYRSYPLLKREMEALKRERNTEVIGRDLLLSA